MRHAVPVSTGVGRNGWTCAPPAAATDFPVVVGGKELAALQGELLMFAVISDTKMANGGGYKETVTIRRHGATS